MKILQKILGKEGAQKFYNLSKDLEKISLNLNQLNKFNKYSAIRRLLEHMIPGVYLVPGIGAIAGKIAIGRLALNKILGYIYSSPKRAIKFNNFFKLLKENKIPQALKLAESVNKMIEDSKEF